jgi:hypothetical protein
VNALSIVLVDTNVIIEAVRTECWPAITGGLHVETVAADLARATFRLAYADAHGLDRGEHDLLAHMYVSDSRDLVLCSPDKAAVRAAVLLGLGDHLRSLDDLLQAVGTRPRKPLRRQFTSAWLRSFRTKVLLEDP